MSVYIIIFYPLGDLSGTPCQQRVTYLAAPLANLAGSFNAEYVRQLGDVSQRRNRSLGVGGLLVYYAPYFFEVCGVEMCDATLLWFSFHA